MVRRHVDHIIAARKQGINPISALPGEEKLDEQALYAAWHFVAGGMESVFLQDANSLILKPADLICILEHIKQTFPEIKRITSYARSSTVARIQDHDLVRIARAGLNRIHIGMESGSDAVLTLVQKGTDKAAQILAGQKIKRAGMELSEYYVPGLGGAELWQENARESADALNQINPDFIRLRTLALPMGAPLTRHHAEGTFAKMGEVATARELLLFLESLEGITSAVKSDHVLNLFSEVNGLLPADREKMTEPVRQFLALEPFEQMLFSIGRRTHCLRTVADLKDPKLRKNAEQACREMGATIKTMDAHIDNVLKKYM